MIMFIILFLQCYILSRVLFVCNTKHTLAIIYLQALEKYNIPLVYFIVYSVRSTDDGCRKINTVIQQKRKERNV